MANRLSARHFGLTLEELDADLTSTKGRLTLSSIPVLSFEKVRAEQKRILRKHTKPVAFHFLVLLGAATFLSLIGFMTGVVGAMMLGWSADIGGASLSTLFFCAALFFVSTYTVLGKNSSFAPWSKWERFHVREVKSTPPEILEREKAVRQLFPRATIWVEVLGLDPFIFLQLSGEEPICFGVWDEREGETFFA